MSDEHEETWVIGGKSAAELIADARDISGLPNARIIIRKHGNSVTLQWAAEGYEGPPWNDSSPCPGSPGCP